eukprot:3844885-Prymnesium_polylepis.1
MRVRVRMLVCECEPSCPHVTIGSEKDVEEVECGAARSGPERDTQLRATTPRSAAPVASPAHSPGDRTRP